MGSRGVGDPMHQPLGAQPVRHELGDRDERQPVLGGERLQLGTPRHRAVGVQDLADHAGRPEPGQPRQVDARLGVADALQHAAALAPAAARCGPGRRRSAGVVAGSIATADRRGAVAGGDPGGDAEAALRVDRHGERGAHRFGVLLHHLRQVEPVAILRREREADPAAPVHAP